MPVIGFPSQSPAAMQSHASEGTFLRAPAHSTLLFSQQGIAFPVLTLVLAQQTSCLMLLPGLHVCWAPWVLDSHGPGFQS